MFNYYSSIFRTFVIELWPLIGVRIGFIISFPFNIFEQNDRKDQCL